MFSGYDYPIFNWHSPSVLQPIYSDLITPMENIIELNLCSPVCPDFRELEYNENQMHLDCEVPLSSSSLLFHNVCNSVPFFEDRAVSSEVTPKGLHQVELMELRKNAGNCYYGVKPIGPCKEESLEENETIHDGATDQDDQEESEASEQEQELHDSRESDFNEEISKIKLQASKSPIMDALVYCALKGWGLELLEENGDNIQFRVTDFKKYYKLSAIICAKQNPTEDRASRIKALKRWFPDFPTKRAGKIDEPFMITVQKPNKKDNKPKKLSEIIEKNRRLLGIKKVRRQR